MKNYFDKKTGELHIFYVNQENDKIAERTFYGINAIIVLHDRIQNRTARIKTCKKMNAPKIILDNEKRDLEEYRTLYQEVLNHELELIGTERLYDALFGDEK